MRSATFQTFSAPLDATVGDCVAGTSECHAPAIPGRLFQLRSATSHTGKAAPYTYSPVSLQVSLTD